MADGDIILQLGFEGVPPFELGSCGAELYEAVAPLAYEDEQHGWPLARLCEAIGRMRQPVSDLVRAWEEEGVGALDGDGRDAGTVTMQRSGWSRAAHPSHGPGRVPDSEDGVGHIDLLPFIGQLVGVRGIERLSDEDRRAAILSRQGSSRGQRESVLSFARRFMIGDRGEGVTLRERYDPSLGADVDAAYRGRVLLKRSRVRDLARENLMPNPRAEFDTNSVGVDAPGMVGASLTRVAAPESMRNTGGDVSFDWAFSVAARHSSIVGEEVLAMTFGGSGRAGFAVMSGLPYTVSAGFEPYALAGGIRWAVRWYDESGALLSTDAAPLEDEASIPWGLYFWPATFMAPAGAAFAQFRMEQVSRSLGQALRYTVSGVMLEQTTTRTWYADGTTRNWRWSGAPHASPSRSEGTTVGEITAALLRRIPAGLIYDVVISDYLDYDELGAEVGGGAPSYRTVMERYTDYTDLLEG